MEIIEKRVIDVLIITLDGRLDASGVITAQNHVNQMIDDGELKIILNLSKVDYMSSSALRLFIGAAKRLSEEKGGFALSSPSPKLQELIELTNLDHIVPLYTTESEAVNAVNHQVKLSTETA